MDETEYGYVFMYIKLKSLLSAVCHSVDTVVIRQETGDRRQDTGIFNTELLH